MRVSITTLSILATAASASYLLEDDYSSDSFASMFDFFTDADPTNGYVNYLSYDQASSSGLYKINNGSVYMGVESTNVGPGRGRDSIRITTTKTYNHGLVILDLEHMPAGACGTWPAFWMLGPDWPNNGEIDIIEGVNSQNANSMTMHTDAGCSITNTGAFSGSLETDDCNTNAPDQATNAGCAIKSQDTTSFGSEFNSNGGGVYATEWTSEAISIRFFPRNGIPSDISSGIPDPSNWGLPQGQFTGNCNIDNHVKDQQLVFDVTFCGDWAGQVWSTDATCSTQASTCQDFVQNNPSAFQDTYWLISSLKVFTENGATPTQTATATETTVSATATSTVATGSATTIATTFIIVIPSATSSTQSTSTATFSSAGTTETTTITIPISSTSSTSLPTSLPTTFVTLTTSSTSSSATESAITTTAPSSTTTWLSSSGAWSSGSWNTATNGGSWGGNSWQGGNNNGNGNTWGNGGDNGNGNDNNGGSWGGHGAGAGWS